MEIGLMWQSQAMHIVLMHLKGPTNKTSKHYKFIIELYISHTLHSNFSFPNYTSLFLESKRLENLYLKYTKWIIACLSNSIATFCGFAVLALFRFAIFYATTIHLPIYNQYQTGHHFCVYVYTLKLGSHSICLYPRLYFEIVSPFTWIIMIVLVWGSHSTPIYSYTFVNF